MAPGVSRRASLATLGTAGLTALAGPFTAYAKKNNNRNKDCKKDKKQCQNDLAACTALGAACTALGAPCTAQVAPCTTAFTTACGDPSDPLCQAVVACCSQLGNCDFTAFLTCLNAAATTSRSQRAMRGLGPALGRKP